MKEPLVEKIQLPNNSTAFKITFYREVEDVDTGVKVNIIKYIQTKTLPTINDDKIVADKASQL